MVYILGYSYKVTTGIINTTYAKLKLNPVLGILLSIENLCFVGKGTWKCQKKLDKTFLIMMSKSEDF